MQVRGEEVKVKERYAYDAWMSNSGANVIITKKNATLKSLSKKYGQTVADLKANNPNLDPSDIKTGTRILLHPMQSKAGNKVERAIVK